MTNTRIRVLRLCRISYIAYTVVSDIEGATVLFDNEDVGTITGGKLTIRIKEEEDTGTHTVAVQGGTLKQKDDEYKFSHLVKGQIPNTANASWNVTDFANITSIKTSYAAKYPAQGQVTLESRMITLNTEYDESSQAVSYTPTTFSTEVNHTLETVPVIVKLTQAESGKEMNVNLLQDAGIQYSYTVYSDIEGVTVDLMNGEEVLDTSTIQDGSHVFVLWHDKAKPSLNVSVTGDGSLLPPAEQTYLFQNNSGKISLPGIGGTFNIADHYNIQSSYSNVTYSFPDVAACDMNGFVTLNKKATESDAVQKTYTPTQIVLDPTETQKDGSIEITQEESGKKLALQYTQMAMVYYEYTVNSDVEGAQVFFDGSLEGTINGGKLVVRKYENIAKESYNVTLQGNLPQDEVTYQFEATQTSLTLNRLGETIAAPITSKKNTKSYSHSTGSVSKNKSVTFNKKSTDTSVNHAYTMTGGTFVSLSGTNLVVTPNDTYKERSETLTFKQNDSDKAVTISVSQSAMVDVTYTVLSNCNGASVKIDSVVKGTISNGQFVYKIIENQAPASVKVEVTGGLPGNTTDYTFTVSPTSLSFSDKGGTKNITITSKSVTTTYVNAAAQNCSKNSSVTMNYTSSKSTNNSVSYSRTSLFGTGVSNSGTSITWAANPDKQQRSGSITWTQSGSNKTATVSLTQAAKVAYAYTVNSNCEGGTVYFNNANKGTISGGRLSFEDDAASGTVRISGGVPSNSSSYITSKTRTNGQDSESDTTTDSTTIFKPELGTTWSSLESIGIVDPGHSGGTVKLGVQSLRQSRVGTRYRYRDIYESRDQYRDTTYSAPSNETAYGDSSAVTMNYTSSTSTRWTSWSFDGYGSWGSWGSWSYSSYSYSRINITITESLSWIIWSKRETGSGDSQAYEISFSYTENTGANRSGYATISNGSESHRVLITQVGVEYVFKFSGSLGAHSANGTTNRNNLTECGGKCRLISYKKVGNTYTLLSVQFASGGQPSQVYDYWAYGDAGSGTNTGWDFAISCKQSPYMSGSPNSRSYTVTMKQIESGKTASITIKQSDYFLNIGNKTTDTYNLVWNAYTKNTNTGYKYPACQSGGDSANWPTWIADSQASWLGLNNGQITYTGKNGSILYCKALSDNKSFSSRTGRFTIGIQGKTSQLSPGTYSFNVVQAAAPNEFYLNLNSYSYSMFAVSRGSVTSLNSTVPQIIKENNVTVNSVITTTNSNAIAAPFTLYGSQQFKLWARNSPTGAWTVIRTFYISPGGTY